MGYARFERKSERMGPMNKKKWIIAIVVVAVAAGATGLWKMQSTETPIEAQETETMTLEATTVEERLLLTGVVTAETELVQSDLIGELVEIKVANGDYVQEGDVLFLIEPEDLTVSIAEAEASLETAKRNLDQAQIDGGQSVQNAFLQAESSYVQAKLDYEIQLQLFELGTVSETAVESAKTAMFKAQSAYISAKAEWTTYSAQEEIASLTAKVLRAEETLENLMEQVDGMEVKAPVTGIVSAVDLKVGDELANGTKLAEVTDTDHLTVEASVSEYDIGKLSLGQTIEVAPIADDESIGIATISYISPKGTIGNSDTTFDIEAVVEDKSDELRANVTVNLDILVAQAKDVLAVPYEALITNGARSMLMVQQGEDFMPIPVSQGVKGDLYVEVSSPDLQTGSVIQIPSTSVAAMQQRVPGMMPGAGMGNGANRPSGGAGGNKQ